jgi:PAS domain S-box-containing protein
MIGGNLVGVRTHLPDLAHQDDGLLRDLQAAHRSEAQLRDFIETSTVGLHWVDANGTVLWANQAEFNLLGFARDQYLGRNIAEFHADDAAIRDILARLSSGETLRDYPARLRHRDGSIRHVLIDSSALFEEGKFIHTRCFTRDITRLKQEQEASQAQLAAELADTRLLQEISAQLIEPGDEAALYVKIVDAIAAIMQSDFATMQVLLPSLGAQSELRLLASRGLSPEGVQTWERVRFDTDSTCGQALRTGKRAIAADVATSDFLAGTEGGSLLRNAGIHAAQSTPLFSRGGKLIGMISSHWSHPHTPSERDLRLLDILARQAADLIERKRSEETRSQLSAIVEASRDAIYAYDLNGIVQTWNPAAEELYGFHADQIIGHSSDSIVPPDRQTELREIFAAAGNTANVLRNLETIRMRRDGTVFPALLTISPILGPTGKTVGLSVIARDVTEQKRAENELRRANEDLAQFAFSASHDLQEPLRTIHIYSELLSESLGELVQGQPEEYLGYLQNAATRMENLVRDLLTYTQITRVDAPLEETDANATLAEALANLGGSIAESGAAITCDPLPTVRIHGTHLRQLFQNLIGNSLKYRSEDRPSAVHVCARREAGTWIFTVRDNGIGVQAEYKKQIFGLFTRLHAASHSSGTGIGLALCQRIVERIGGRIWVDSEFGQGSDFHFTLPA